MNECVLVFVVVGLVDEVGEYDIYFLFEKLSFYIEMFICEQYGYMMCCFICRINCVFCLGIQDYVQIYDCFVLII